MWVRGLKHYNNLLYYHHIKVAPYVGAWIETITICAGGADGKSHPMWVRGLKLSAISLNLYKNKSHPMWVRGLKLI